MNVPVLLASGWVEDDAAKTQIEADSEHMHATGAYVVLGVFTQGAVQLQFEQNTAQEILGGGLSAVVTHPAVCTVSSPKGRVTCNAQDTDLILAVAADLT